MKPKTFNLLALIFLTSIFFWSSCDKSPASPSASQSVQSQSEQLPRGQLNHRTDFLTLPGIMSTLLLPGEPERLSSALSSLKSRNYTDVYLYVVNEGDFGGLIRFNWYSSPEGYREILQTVVSANIRPVVWLAPDDSPVFHQTSVETLPAIWQTFIPVIDDLVGSYVLGLEMNEYWEREEQIALAAALPTNKPVFIHFTKGRRESISSYWPRIKAAGLLYQYENPTSAGVREETLEVVRALSQVGKVVVAGEYKAGGSESSSRSLGDIAIDNGAIGYGNGGTR